MSRTTARANLIQWSGQAVQAKRGLDRLGLFAADPTVQTALLHLLKDENINIRRSVATALYNSAVASNINPALFSLFSTEEDKEVSLDIAWILDNVFEKGTVEQSLYLQLVPMLKSGNLVRQEYAADLLEH